MHNPLHCSTEGGITFSSKNCSNSSARDHQHVSNSCSNFSWQNDGLKYFVMDFQHLMLLYDCHPCAFFLFDGINIKRRKTKYQEQFNDRFQDFNVMKPRIALFNPPLACGAAARTLQAAVRPIFQNKPQQEGNIIL
ncbi:unnamed protein product [Lepeophtheirus salmonis]|uniref:(salmon louse) hypothetical protein n=1 Tax=Lepeophtheirus salmonis TaxID=72036 RepID=A0A7R8H234_LEPSM|nr:unnamed protein product [Lepeophtheirus salmonis]CAF2817898.1 unnamed protein product [Lepeophtheirus salmonis]